LILQISVERVEAIPIYRLVEFLLGVAHALAPGADIGGLPELVKVTKRHQAEALAHI
jgi:hypothetical protein